MKLDPRIKKGKKPLTPLDIEKAKEFIGKECYFTNDLREYEDLTTVTAKILGRVGNSFFFAEKEKNRLYVYVQLYTYCLPCDWVVEKRI